MPISKVAIGLVWHEGRLVVGRRPDGAVLAGFHEFPGGKCREDEEPSEAVVREVREETGLDVRVLALRDHYVHDYPHGAVELYFFDCQVEKAMRALPRLTEPFQWWDLGRLCDATFPEANRAILESLRKSPAPLSRWPKDSA